MTETCPPEQRASLSARWEPSEVEQRLYEQWVDAGYFTGTPAGGKPAFCIVILLHNVTGSLHLGHAMDHTLIDILTRRRRMQGYDALWLSGMDHAGIATQNVVERQLAAPTEHARLQVFG